MRNIVFFDLETDIKGDKILDIGAITLEDNQFHSNNQSTFTNFISKAEYLCGHNVFEHDLKYIKDSILRSNITKFIDTLYWSPLLFPTKPYHKLGKQYKLVSEAEQNNPLLDSLLARDLFIDEIAAFNSLDKRLKCIYYSLLKNKLEFKDFFHYIGYSSYKDCLKNIKSYFSNKICANANIENIIKETPVELAYALALINTEDRYSVTPSWVLRHFPLVENIMFQLCSHRCVEGCDYCNEKMNALKALKRYFNYTSFRKYEGESLQENAANAAIDGKSLLAIFPTAGGKSITFQLPALMQGEVLKGLTVVISPLQSLMKDQVDNLEKKGIIDAVTINGSLDPIERAKAFERVEDGSASILYLSPESLRSKSIETVLLKRHIVRFVIDEAHCFSAWGQDFRVDYLYIGDFIKEYQTKKDLKENIPVSCFTATAKQKVLEDIINYFKEKLSLDLVLYRSGAQRVNLKYYVFVKSNEEEKYQKLRQLIESNEGPIIVYTSRTKRTMDLARRLSNDIDDNVVYYHGKMDRQQRLDSQDKFMREEARVIVATTAFGMGVDKNNVGVVIHYDISTSIEDYVQEAGRAGRDENIQAKCYVLFNDEDLMKHFILLNQTQVSKDDIHLVWNAIKNLTRIRKKISVSALEIAREAGWDDRNSDMEIRVKTAISALETSGFVKRGQNMPRVFANSILVKNMLEASAKINSSLNFVSDKERQEASIIMSKLLSAKSRYTAGNEDGESRVDYLSDSLGIVKENVIRIINILREERILADVKDLVAFIKRNAKVKNSLEILNEMVQIEKYIIESLYDFNTQINLKEMNENIIQNVPQVNIQKLTTLFNYYKIKHLIQCEKKDLQNTLVVKSNFSQEDLLQKCEKRNDLAYFIVKYLFEKCARIPSSTEEIAVEFSCLEIKEAYEQSLFGVKCSFDEIDDALFYLLKIGALRLDGAFLVVYSAMRIERLEDNMRRKYTKEDYKQLENFYLNKRRQIHIVGEYVKKLTEDYGSAMDFVDDYFKLNFDSFLRKYFKGREVEISQNITPKKFKQLFGDLSPTQLSIIKDSQSKYIVVAAGPGSGKTKVLVHKLASLYIMEDVKHEQMLMLTFSRAAANEFKKRLLSPEMLGNAASFIQISTFHSYCFDLLGKIGSLVDTGSVIEQAVEKIKSGEIERNRITKTVLVIDEAQDMSETEFSLVQALMEVNEEMRIIAVGDDDQNIYEFRKSDSKYLKSLIDDYNATKYELLDNYRSKNNIVQLANEFVKTITVRLKTTPINYVQKDNGNVVITKYHNQEIIVPVMQDIMSRGLSGTVCVLTETNDLAATITGLLNRNGLNARLIQDNTGFNIMNLVEIRYFVDSLKLTNDIYTIDEQRWNLAKQAVKEKYCSSAAYEYVNNLIKTYEEICKGVKYKTDFMQYIYESKLEDFCDVNSSQIVVSTIHKAKGREFDNVFLVVNQNPITNDKKRALYVAMTRAKINLYIHTTTNCFDNINLYNVKKLENKNTYFEAKELVLPVSYKGVHLSTFYYCKKAVNKLQCGDELKIAKCTINLNDGRTLEKYMCFDKNGDKVLQFSDAMCNIIESNINKGFLPISASIRLMIWWANTSDDGQSYQETKIILPDILFKKN